MKPSPPTRRDVLAAALATSAVAGLAGGCQGTQRKGAPRAQSQRGPIAGCEPIPHVRFGMIGVGDRGSTHVRLINRMTDAEIVAVADPHGPAAEATVAACRAAGKAEPVVYGNGEHDYRNLLERGDVDVVLISTPWRWHEPQAVEAMRAGKHALVEVPLALTIDELWSVVETCEATGRHCMMLENVNYGQDELLTLNLCRQGVFGELLHAEAAYIHDLRSQMHDIGWGTGSWRTAYHAYEHGNLYPTHGLGPVAHCMNLDRTEDRFDSLVSMGSPARGRNLYATEHLPADHPHRAMQYVCGDINTSVVRTRLGRTIMIQYDTTSPRPYTRHNLVQGTRGCMAGFPTRLVVEGWGDTHEWIEGEALDEVRRRYEHPLWTRMGREAQEAGGHGGMDFIMLRRVVECLRAGEPLDQTAYEGASWSVVRPLSEASVLGGGRPVSFPDFSRGRYRDIAPLRVIV